MTDTERLEWCIARLFHDDYLTTDTGCGCCGEIAWIEGLTARQAIDAQIEREKLDADRHEKAD